MLPISTTRALLALLATAPYLPAQDPVETTYPDGTIKERYETNKAGEKHGTYEKFYPSGFLEIRAKYSRGELDGAYESYWPDSMRRVAARYRRGKLTGKYRLDHEDATRAVEFTYRDGVRHGTAKVLDIDDKTIGRQKWRDGVLVEWNGVPAFTESSTALRAALRAIERVPEPKDGTTDERRAAALRRLMAYRRLCRLPFEGMSLVDDWNEKCAAAAEVVARNGKLSHTPPKPNGMSEDRYRLGYEGASSSNLHAGGGMVQSIDGYMDDSDPSNIDRVGHRRWCLNPAMKKTGFGEKDGYAAMWAFDASGRRAKGIDAVMYPPPGYVPVDYFGSRHAWSVALLGGGNPKKEEIEIRIVELDDDYVEIGEPLALDHLGVGDSGQGTGACLIFRPTGLFAEAGRKYFVEIQLDGRGRPEFRYLVEFCEAAKP